MEPTEDPDVKVSFELEHLYIQGPQVQPRTFAQPLDAFRHVGPNNTHNCLVTELLGPTLALESETLDGLGKRLQPEMVLRCARQVLEGLAFAHGAGYVHGGEKVLI